MTEKRVEYAAGEEKLQREEQALAAEDREVEQEPLANEPTMAVLQQFADALATCNREVEQLRQQLAEVTRLLEDLTIGGSEFAGNPKRCADWVREQMSSSLNQAITASGETNQLRQQLATMQAERDEAREVVAAEVKAGQKAKDIWQQMLGKVVAERDQAQAALGRANGKR